MVRFILMRLCHADQNLRLILGAQATKPPAAVANLHATVLRVLLLESGSLLQSPIIGFSPPLFLMKDAYICLICRRFLSQTCLPGDSELARYSPCLSLSRLLCITYTHDTPTNYACISRSFLASYCGELRSRILNPRHFSVAWRRSCLL